MKVERNIARRAARASRARARAVPAAVLVVGLLITGVAAWASAANVHGARESAFEDLAHDARTAFQRRLAAYSEALFGMRSLFSTSAHITRKQFHDYVSESSLSERLPGVQALELAPRVTEPDLASFERAVRADRSLDPNGNPGFAVHPRTHVATHYPADYVEPLEGNSLTFGYDMASSPERRAAIEEARDTGALTGTEPVRLVQETSTRGFLLYLAVYDVAHVPNTAPARRRHFVGVVSAVFRVRDMLGGVLGISRLRIEEVYDVGPTVASSPESLSQAGVLTDLDPEISARRPSTLPSLHRFLDLNVGSRRWRLLAVPGRGFVSPAQAAVPWIIIGAGGALSFALAVLVSAIAQSRSRAVALAAEMTVDLRHHERELEDANERLLAANEAVREFVAIASHDMRSPLAALTGFTKLLREGWETISPEERERYMRAMERRGDELTRLVDDLFLMSEIDAGALKVHPEEIALHPVFERISREFEGIHTAPADGLAVRADPIHLSRMLTNYLDNARKYGAHPVHVEARSSGDSIEIRVSDRGPGVPDQFMPRLFEKFARAAADDRSGVPGTGLGLSIVRGLAHANEGEAWHERNAPQGAIFVVKLPRA